METGRFQNVKLDCRASLPLGHNHRQCAPQRAAGCHACRCSARCSCLTDSSAASRASRSVGAVPSRRRCPSAITFHRYPPAGAARTRVEYFATGSPSRREERKPPGQRRLLNDRTGKGPIAVESEVASQTCDTGLRSAGPRRPQQPSNLSDAAGRRSVVFELHHVLHGVLGRAGKHRMIGVPAAFGHGRCGGRRRGATPFRQSSRWRRAIAS